MWALFENFGYLLPLVLRYTLSHNDEIIKGGSKGRSFHRLWTDETKAAFIIDVPGEIASKWKPLDSLKQVEFC
jgi:hypothetical protein